jgi:hypothetical protein
MIAIFLFCEYASTVFMSLPDYTFCLQLAVHGVDILIITVSSGLLIYWSRAVAKLLAEVKRERDSPFVVS